MAVRGNTADRQLAGAIRLAAIEVWQIFSMLNGRQPIEFLSTHPASDARIEHIRNLLPEVIPIYNRNVAAISPQQIGGFT